MSGAIDIFVVSNVFKKVVNMNEFEKVKKMYNEFYGEDDDTLQKM